MNALLLRLLTVTLLWLSACCLSQAINHRAKQGLRQSNQRKTAQSIAVERPSTLAVTLPLPADSSQISICLRWP